MSVIMNPLAVRKPAVSTGLTTEARSSRRFVQTSHPSRVSGLREDTQVEVVRRVGARQSPKRAHHEQENSNRNTAVGNKQAEKKICAAELEQLVLAEVAHSQRCPKDFGIQ